MFRKRCDLYREQNQPLIEQKLPASGSSKSGEEMNCFIGQAVGVYFGIKIFRFSNRGYIWPKLPPRVIFIWGNGFHACSRKHAPEAGRRTATENHRNWPLRKFCVSDIRQNQEYHITNVHDWSLFPLAIDFPGGWDGMRAVTA